MADQVFVVAAEVVVIDFDQQLILLKKALYSGKYVDTQAILDQLIPTSATEHRIAMHFQGILWLRLGEYSKAQNIFEQALSTWGHNICLMLDLAASFYMSHQVHNWLITLLKIQMEYSTCKDFLTVDKHIIFLLLYGKFTEEKGEIKEALDIYKQGADLAFSKILTPKFRKNYTQLLAQILRLKAQHRIFTDLQKNYEDLKFHSPENTDFDCHFDSEHALLLAENLLFGAHKSFDRITSIEANPLMTSHESVLIYTDLIYDYLLQKKPIPAEIITKLEKIDHLNTYEKTILKIARNEKLEGQFLVEIFKNLTPSAAARIISVQINNCEPEHKDLLKAKLNIFIQPFSAATKKIWTDFFGLDLEDKSTAVIYCKSKNTLEFNQNYLMLTKLKSYHDLIDVLAKSEDLNIYSIAKMLWNNDVSESDISRLKMRIHRLNAKLSKVWSITHFISIKDQEIILNYQFKMVS